ncbi:hypothetical protein [Vibrio cholerae]|uniref:hypothetical protein n=1 Tax=Vibrio cholerae TaxID=666 RepID=UPI000E0B5BCE|nr:hypothetical protein [Vibrio cholerae]
MQLAEFLSHRFNIDQVFIEDCISLILESNPDTSIGDCFCELEPYINTDLDDLEREIAQFAKSNNVSLDIPLSKALDLA